VTVSLGTGLNAFTAAPGSPFSVGTNPQFVVAADWNGDGKMDLATANTDSNNVSVLLGDGAGGFAAAAASPIPFTSGPTTLAVSDFNLDGIVDMAVDAGNQRPTIILGVGDGTFVAAVASLGAPGRLAATVGDFNTDGKPDLAVGFMNIFAPVSNFSVLLGNGNGGYVNAGNSSANGTGTRNVVIADFNSDGQDDVAVFGTADFTNSFLSIFLGNATGGFTTAPGSPITLGGRCVDWLSAAVADYNGDGKPDIALTNSTGACGSALYPHGKVSLLIGMGTGAFSVAPGSPFTVGTNPQSVAAADFNGDGRPDLVVANNGSNDLTILSGLGVSTVSISVSAGSQAVLGQPVTLTASIAPSSAIGIVTFYQDTTILGTAIVGAGQATLTTRQLSVGVHQLSAYYSGGQGLASGASNRVPVTVTSVASSGFTPAANSPLAVLSAPYSIISADFNGDSKIDLAVANRGSNYVSILLGDGAGGFTPSPGSSLLVGFQPITLGAADFNRDGITDLAVGIGSQGFIFLGNGDGSFAPVSTGWSSFTSDQLTVADFNEDGIPDIATGQVFLGNGQGSLAGLPFLQGSFTPTTIHTAADFNADGHVDGLVQGGTVFYGLGTGRFASGTLTAADPRITTVADFNGDGLNDIATTTATPNSISVYFSNGAGLFATAPGNPFALGAAPAALASLDFNGDSKFDIAIASSVGLTILLGNGTGGFSPGPTSPFSGDQIAVGDFNGDGRADVALTNGSANTVTVLLGSGAPPPPQAPTLVSNAPATVIGSPQSFSITARDPSGFADIYRVYFLVNISPTIPANTCHGFYDRALNAFFLYDDALGALLGPVVPGIGSIVQNSQCTLHGAASTVGTASGTDLPLTLSLTLKAPYSSASRNVYFWVQDLGANGTGWVKTTTWATAGSNPPPSIVSAVPVSAFGATQTFKITARSPGGFADISRIYFVFNLTPTVPQNSCHGFYDRGSNSVFLFNDALTAVLGPTGLANSQCAISGPPQYLESASGTDLIINITFTRLNAFATATHNVYFLATNTQGANSGWTLTGTWSPIQVSQPPAAIPGGPANPIGSPQTFTFTGRDPDGFANIKRLYFLVNTTTTPAANTCHGFYDRASNGVFLYNDALTALADPLTPGGSAFIENSQCRISGETSSLLSSAGADLVIRLGIQLKNPYSSTPQSVYFLAQDMEFNNSGWVQNSTWTHVPVPAGTPSVVSGVPANLAGSPGIITFTARDPNGFRDIYRLYFLINTNSNIPANTCHGFYDRLTNGIYLYNDALTAPMGPIIPGYAGVWRLALCGIKYQGQVRGGAGQ